MTQDNGRLTDNALEVLRRRYLLKDSQGQVVETPKDLFKRVAHYISQAEDKEVPQWTSKFFKMMWDLDFLPNSPTLMNAGAGAGSLSACYVLNIDDSMAGIMQAATDQAMIEKFGGGVGFSLSGVRPKGVPVKSTQGKACGPVEVLKTLSRVGSMITQGGRRDGAHMAVMSVYHPDIEEFIGCKQVEGEIHNFNISVGVSHKFMEAVRDDHFIHLDWPMNTATYTAGEPALTEVGSGQFIKARDLFNKIVEGAWANGEPGLVYLDRINGDNANPELGEIEATNPCGEQPLLDNESCTLGSINLSNFVIDDPSPKMDYDRLATTITTAVRFLDDVVSVNRQPTELTQHMNDWTRKIGLGVMGWADTLIKLRIPYDSQEALDLVEVIGHLIQKTADTASSDLGSQRGSFLGFDESPLNIENGGMFQYLRNAWRLSIAPTGTIAMIAGCSYGIEPLFALVHTKKNMSAAMEGVELNYAHPEIASRFTDVEIKTAVDRGEDLQNRLMPELQGILQTTHEISPHNHVQVQAAWQQWIDSGVSKTINLPNSATRQEVFDVYMLAWNLGCKGITVYREGSRDKEVIVSSFKPEDVSLLKPIEVDGVVDTPPAVRPRERPRVVTGSTELVNTGHGKAYITANRDENDKLFEVFISLGKAGGCDSAQMEAVTRLASLAMRSGIDPAEVVEQLRGITCCPSWDRGTLIRSSPDAVASVMGEALGISPEAQDTTNDGVCPDCGGGPLVQTEGCTKCLECGFSECG